jgi:hypothetical protein
MAPAASSYALLVHGIWKVGYSVKVDMKALLISTPILCFLVLSIPYLTSVILKKS